MQTFLTEGSGISVIDVVKKRKGHKSQICRLSLASSDTIIGNSSIESGYVGDASLNDEWKNLKINMYRFHHINHLEMNSMLLSGIPNWVTTAP